MSVEPVRAATGRTVAVLALKIAVSGVLLYLLLTRVDMHQLGASAANASVPWLIAALVVYFLHVLMSVWRWRLLLDAQRVSVASVRLLSSYLVAMFFNNFLPSNIGGDVVRIRDTAGAARSRTLATTVILVDRGFGLLSIVLFAAVAASLTSADHQASPIWPSWLWAGFFVAVALGAPAVLTPSGFSRLLQPLTALHPEWITGRIGMLTTTLARFREQPAVLAGCFTGALIVQMLLVLFHLAVGYALHLPVTFWTLAVIVPVSFVVQMIPVSINGFGVREAAFSYYFTRLGLPIEAAVLVSLGATLLMMVFSLSGAMVYVARGEH
jgi:uncharacterized membrane protein YbhN (UPF0104 family)